MEKIIFFGTIDIMNEEIFSYYCTFLSSCFWERV